MTECEQVFNAMTELESDCITAYDIAEVTELPTITCEHCLNLLWQLGRIEQIGERLSQRDRVYRLREGDIYV